MFLFKGCLGISKFEKEKMKKNNKKQWNRSAHLMWTGREWQKFYTEINWTHVSVCHTMAEEQWNTKMCDYYWSSWINSASKTKEENVFIFFESMNWLWICLNICALCNEEALNESNKV